MNMSEFSESYHLFSTNQEDGVKLLKRAWLRGYVFQASQHWVTVLPKGTSFQPNKRMIAANRGILIHLIHAEDHGWTFSIYDGNKRTCHFECTWEEDIEINQEDYHRDRIVELINNNPYRSRPVTPLEITKIFYINDFDEMFENNPVDQLAELLGLQHYEWLSYDYLQNDIKANPSEVEGKGIKVVSGILGF